MGERCIIRPLFDSAKRVYGPMRRQENKDNGSQSMHTGQREGCNTKISARKRSLRSNEKGEAQS